jgi:hypothetical protein
VNSFITVKVFINIFAMCFPNYRSLKEKLLACMGSAKFKSRTIDDNTEGW